MRELVSVIVPVYNVELYLKFCVESIIMQTYENLEIILVDDGSKDGSPHICDAFLNKDKRVRVIHQQNQGLSAARNAGIEVARGKYFTFVDSDDYIRKDMIERLVNLVERKKVDIACCEYEEVFFHKKIPVNYERGSNLVYRNRVDELKELFGTKRISIVVAWGKVYKAELWKDIRFPIGKLHEDESTTYKIISKAKKIVHSDRKMYYYFQRSDSIMGSDFNEKKLELLDELKKQISFFEQENLRSVLPDATFNYLRRIAMSYAYYKECRGKKSKLEEIKKRYTHEYKEMRSYIDKLDCRKQIILKIFLFDINVGRIVVKIKKKFKQIKMLKVK